MCIYMLWKIFCVILSEYVQNSIYLYAEGFVIKAMLTVKDLQDVDCGGVCLWFFVFLLFFLHMQRQEVDESINLSHHGPCHSEMVYLICSSSSLHSLIVSFSVCEIYSIVLFPSSFLHLPQVLPWILQTHCCLFLDKSPGKRQDVIFRAFSPHLSSRQKRNKQLFVDLKE